jgi:hypothetical protein
MHRWLFGQWRHVGMRKNRVDDAGKRGLPCACSGWGLECGLVAAGS